MQNIKLVDHHSPITQTLMFRLQYDHYHRDPKLIILIGYLLSLSFCRKSIIYIKFRQIVLLLFRYWMASKYNLSQYVWHNNIIINLDPHKGSAELILFHHQRSMLFPFSNQEATLIFLFKILRI